MEPPSPSPSPSLSKVEVIKQAIKEVMEEASIRDGDTGISDDSFVDVDDVVEDDDDRRHHHRLLLSKLLSQLEMLKAEDNQEADAQEFPRAAVSRPDSTSNNEVTKANRNPSEDDEEKIVKEIKKVKKQNLITHCLLSVMIVLTLAWQVSEVSLILKLKDGVTHPFRSIGSIFLGKLKPPKPNGNEDEKDLTSESSPLKIPEFPHVELPKFDLGYDEED